MSHQIDFMGAVILQRRYHLLKYGGWRNLTTQASIPRGYNF